MDDNHHEFKMPTLDELVYVDGPRRTDVIAVVFRSDMVWWQKNEPFTPPGDRLFKATYCDDHGFPRDDAEPYAIMQKNGVVKLASGETLLGHCDEFRFFGQRRHQFLTPC